jgi:hypothetical protein
MSRKAWHIFDPDTWKLKSLNKYALYGTEVPYKVPCSALKYLLY